MEEVREPDIDKREKSLKEQRQNLTLLKRPHLVTYYFLIVLILAFKRWSSFIATHKITVFLAFPCTVTWIALRHLEEDLSHHHYMDEISKSVSFCIWWIGLGVLSSVGLGTGMHSGVLFLFPHIFKVVTAAEECGITIVNGLDIRNDTWFNSVPFSCEGNDHPDKSQDMFWLIFISVFPACFLWGTGTAMGEIPPYALSKAARLSGEKDEDFEEITNSQSSWNIINKSKDWMISFLETHGFIGVFLMSAWPNMAFDLCGICCGHFLMPFWTFFIATWLGKAVVKVNGQAIFFIFLFSDRYLKTILRLVEEYTPTSLDLGNNLEEFLMKTRAKFHQNSQNQAAKSDSILQKLGNFFMFCLIGWFAISCVEQVCQQYVAEIDAATIQALRSKEARLTPRNSTTSTASITKESKKEK